MTTRVPPSPGGRLVIQRPEEEADQFLYHSRITNEIGTILSDEAHVYFGCEFSFKLVF